MKTIWCAAISAMLIMVGIAACNGVDLAEAVSSEKVTNLAYAIDGRHVTLTWQLPSSENVSGVQIIKNNEDVVELEGRVESYYVKRADTNVETAYTVKAMYGDGRVSEGVTVRFTVEGVVAKVGYLLPCNSIEMLEDDDELAAAEWFRASVSNGVLLTPSDLADLDPDEISALWIHIDRIGLVAGWEYLPAALTSEETLAALKQYAADGGNLLLTKHATQLTAALGLLPDEFAPGLFGSGEGGEGLDVWTCNAQIGCGQSPVYDHRNHPIYAGLSICDEYEHETYPMIGPGWREDHNCMWDLNSYGLAGTPNVVVAFEEATNTSVLATWGHVTDYCCAGIIEILPSAERLGRCIAIGLSAYEWNQNSGENLYQDNIERLTSNCLSYLK